MSNKTTLADRLADILVRLNSGESLSMSALAEQYGVNKRTLQRDINARLAFLPIDKSGDRFHLAAAAMGKLSNQDIRNFSSLVGVSQLFPSLDAGFIANILSNTLASPYLIKGYHYEDNPGLRQSLDKLTRAINAHHCVSLHYKGKVYPRLAPYRLVNNKGIWYLAAVDGATLKAFQLSAISNQLSLPDTFEPDPAIQRAIEEADGIFFGSKRLGVTVKVSAEVASYFQRRSLLPYQETIETLPDGGMILRSEIHHPRQIIPLIKYWAPEMEVLDPPSIDAAVRADLTRYLSR
ncbi:helix-turn-helix transcriptional regulator [Ferrimonas balearica]|uniref:helix-turn-helix transcriptional regulator n=1 Tax=Ferrimonas balearica TaxID=44012 RepID=UPI001C942D59|nr:WYL domain-containing protein [Ferrimonas balearica]MBY5981332.1 WYL domain-containing protein [Ferrimonas balearica]